MLVTLGKVSVDFLSVNTCGHSGSHFFSRFAFFYNDFRIQSFQDFLHEIEGRLTLRVQNVVDVLSGAAAILRQAADCDLPAINCISNKLLNGFHGKHGICFALERQLMWTMTEVSRAR